MNTIDALHWRYATQQFDATKILSDAQLEIVKESLRLAPSSYGLQPYHFFIISNAELRAKLRAAGYDQSKITEASHLVVITVPTNLDDRYVDQFIESVAQIKGVSTEVLAGYAGALKGKIAGMDAAARIEWAARQAYITLGTLLTSLASESIDAGPMEGFDPMQFDEILGLNDKNLTTVVIAAIGFRSAEDAASKNPKTRLSQAQLITEIK